MSDCTTCPDCGGALQIVPDGQVSVQYAPAFHVRGAEIPTRLEQRPVAVCTECEYCIVIRRA